MRPRYIVLAAVAVILGAGGLVSLFGAAPNAVAAHDTRVKSDLAAIAAALETYYDKNHTYRIPDTGYAGEGEGWVGITLGTSSDAYYTHSILGKLQKLGILSSLVTDDATYTYPNHPTPRNYMLYVCDSGQTYALSATLEQPAATSTAKHLNCKAKLSNAFGKNYLIAKTHKSKTAPATAAAVHFPSCTLTASKSATGQGVILAWRAKGADAVILQSSRQGTVSAVPPVGSMMVAPPRTVTYSVVATNAAGATKCKRSVAAVASAGASAEAPAGPYVASAPLVSALSQVAGVAVAFASGNAPANPTQMRQTIGDLARISLVLSGHVPQVARLVSLGAAIDIYTAADAAHNSNWDSVYNNVRDFTADMYQMSALVSQMPRGSVPNPGLSAAQNARLCANAAYMAALQADAYTVEADYHQSIGAPGDQVAGERAQAQSALARQQTYQNCANSFGSSSNSNNGSGGNGGGGATNTGGGSSNPRQGSSGIF